MESLGVHLLTLAKENSILTILVVVALALGVLHELRIGVDVLALLIHHIREEFGRSATSFGTLGDALSTRKRQHVDQWRLARRRRHRRTVVRHVIWLRRRTHRYRLRRGFFPRHTRRHVQ